MCPENQYILKIYMMDKRIIDITGMKFGRLIVESYSHSSDKKTYWNCICECGNHTVVRGDLLKGGNTKSCGCITHEPRGTAHNRKDLTGMIFGDLEVLGYAGTSNKKAQWLCVCKCGRTSIVNGNNLTTGKISSCGCSRKHKLMKDLVGQTFGRLTVVSFEYVNKHREAMWLCKCICGNESIVSGHNLLAGAVKSCGCSKRIDLIGQTFGRLTVLEFAGINNQGGVLWKCECSCGNECITSSHGMINGHTKSCGCLNKDILKSQVGNNNPNWRDDLTDEDRTEMCNKRRLMTPKYNIWRHSVFSRDEYTCQICGSRGDIQAHHIKRWANHPELRYDINNGVTLCKKCHKELHKGKRIA